MGNLNQLVGGGPFLADANGLWDLRSTGWARWNPRPVDDGSGLSFLPSHWPAQGDLLHACHNATAPVAVLLILMGIVYLLFGFSIAKILVTLNAAILGGWVGAMIGDRIGGDGASLPGAVVAGLLAATAAWPTMKWSVAVMGGMLGAVLGVVVWRLVDLDPNFGWSGGLTGLVLCALLSLLLFRPCVMTYTSIQGAAMLVFGVLALALKHEDVGPMLNAHLQGRPFVLPMTIFVPTLLGYIYQQTMSAAPVGPPPPPAAAPKKP